MIEKLNIRERFLFFSVLFTLSGWLAFSLLLSPLLEKNKNLVQLIQSKEIKHLKLQKTLSQKDLLKKQFEKISILEKSNDSEELDNSKLLKIIDDSQKKLGVQITNLAPLKPETLSFYKRLSVNVEIQDSMQNILRFIMELRDTPEKLNVINLKFIPGKNNEQLKASMIVAQLMALK